MDIAALSILMNQSQVRQQASMSVLKMAMDMSKVQSVDLEKMIDSNKKTMELSIQPELGSHIDVKL
ncbi:putative motility protein [Heliorestis acidaminivorans]|uniref:Putative motility protein n=1 Tax=Heliorestis acidaminivorans TaxID=553427 RepID=A0A6I0ETL5_9FIRM|nr:YjfB family protein [Heliorestis acidaminivorans]KAB2953429.1 putative motility protein [Heliorestis acidaminivorans]